jgi:hypothetical protein
MDYPRTDIMDLCKVTDTTFWPLNRQELSRTAGGRTQARDLGSPLWQASFTTAPARHSDAAAIEAALISLNGLVGSFLAYDKRRPYPVKHADGNFADTAVISAVTAFDAFFLRLGGLASGFTLSPGDYLAFEYGSTPSRALHIVTVGGTAGAAGTIDLEVFPPLRAGATANTPVTLKKASCEMILNAAITAPTITSMVASSVSFTAIQIF